MQKKDILFSLSFLQPVIYNVVNCIPSQQQAQGQQQNGG